jgi:hypothetical protein
MLALAVAALGTIGTLAFVGSSSSPANTSRRSWPAPKGNALLAASKALKANTGYAIETMENGRIKLAVSDDFEIPKHARAELADRRFAGQHVPVEPVKDQERHQPLDRAADVHPRRAEGPGLVQLRRSLARRGIVPEVTTYRGGAEVTEESLTNSVTQQGWEHDERRPSWRQSLLKKELKRSRPARQSTTTASSRC